MKPLTIDELKALQVGDWVWIVEKEISSVGKYHKIIDGSFYAPRSIFLRTDSGRFAYAWDFSDYGTKWLAYKNKEQAECKGEIVELPCNVGDTVYIIDNDRHWAKIDTIRIYEENNGKQKVVYEWVQLDVGVDVTEVWDDGEFDIEDIGKTVLLEKVHEEQIQQLISEENLRHAQWEEESKAERRLAELRG